MRKSALISGSTIATLIVLEILLRSCPVLLPTGVYYGSGVYNHELGFHLPSSPVIYNKDRYVKRTPNSWGFQDIEHQVKKPRGTTRIGFFGDSYVESIQVPLEEVFFRQVPDSMEQHHIETMAYGISGLGTLHACMLYNTFGSQHDLDLVIYVFVGNDPADHNDEIVQKRKGIYASRPTAALEGDSGYRILGTPKAPGMSLRSLAYHIKNRSLLMRVIYARIKLLSRNPVAKAKAAAPFGPNTWNPKELANAQELTFRIMRDWHERVVAGGKTFAVLYVPSRMDLKDIVAPEESWRLWLRGVCTDLDIALIDPTSELRAQHSVEEPVYADHWTPKGHEIVAVVVTEFLTDWLKQTPDPLPSIQEVP